MSFRKVLYPTYAKLKKNEYVNAKGKKSLDESPLVCVCVCYKFLSPCVQRGLELGGSPLVSWNDASRKRGFYFFCFLLICYLDHFLEWLFTEIF